MIERIQRLKRAIGKNKEKKIERIQSFIREKFGNDEITIREIDDLEKLDNELEDNDFENMYDIITEKYNDNYPYFVFKYEFSRDKNLQHWKNIIQEQFKENDKLKCSNNIDIVKLSIIETAKGFFLDINYLIYDLKPTMDGKVRDVNTAKRAKGRIIFLNNEQLALFTIGDYKHTKDLYNFFIRNYIDTISFTPYHLNENSFKYDGPIENDRITVFLLELVTNAITEQGKVEISDYTKIGFSNLKNKEGLNTIKVGGSNLLNASEVAEQIRNGFKLKLVEFTVIWFLDKERTMKINVSIMLKDILKITIVKSDNYTYNEDVVKYLFEKIVALAEKGISLKKANTILSTYFSKIESRLKMQIKLDRENCLEKLKEYKELNDHMELIKKIYDEM